MVKLTLTPGRMGEADVAKLRTHGFTDAQIFNATAVASYFAYINRMADGLGVDLEPEWRDREPFPPWEGAGRGPS